MYLVGSVGKPQRARGRVHGGEREVLGDAGSAVQLNGIVDDL